MTTPSLAERGSRAGWHLSPAWMRLAALSVLSAYFFIAMEWLFQATKPSFLRALGFGTQLGVLLLPGLLVSAAVLAGLLALFALSRLPGLARFEKALLGLGALLPGAFLAATALMMVDNFTYTVLKFGIVSTSGVGRGLYGLFFLALLGGFTTWAARGLYRAQRHKRVDPGLRNWLYASGALLALSLPIGGSLYVASQTTAAGMAVGELARTPNILLIGSDGLNADQMSLYGGQAAATPFLHEFARQALLAENNFTNANITSGSLVSMFTSKLPTQTRMLYPPDVLRGSDAFQHLPGILKKAGYYNAEISVDYYADPEMLNLQDGFVMVNGRSATIGRLYTFSRRFLPESAAYFLSTFAKRVSDRLFHIFYLRAMPNPYAEVTQQLSTMSDEDRLGMVISLFRDIRQPLFIHAHLMGTHITEDAGYQEGIANFDQYLRGLVKELEAMGRLDDTVIIVYTDHGHNNTSNIRTPLLFRFPNGEHAGRITSSTQNLDVAPTLLEYLGVQPPAWMEGQSLLQKAPSATRPLFNARPNYRVEIDERLQLDTSKTKPPFYQFGVVNMLVCQKWYSLETTTLTWTEGEVEGYVSPCKEEDLPGLPQAQEMLLEQLRADGFDVQDAAPGTGPGAVGP